MNTMHILGVAACGALFASCVSMAASVDVERDRRAIEQHIRGLFEAYLHYDRDAIRRGHTDDWCGFPIAADRLVRGIDAYMEYADLSLERFRGIGYSIDELDIQVRGDTGIVYYTATWRFLDADDAEQVLPLRSVDIYRREAGGWNQAGSNICAIAREG